MDAAFHQWCEWLPADRRDLLLSHVDRSESWLGQSAFAAYLAKAPTDTIEWLQQAPDRQRWPAWREQIFGRFQCAPEPLRAPRYLADIQVAESDCRLVDPLGPRRI